MTLDEQQVRQRADRVDTLLEQVESMPDPGRTTTLELLQAVLELYGEGLARIVADVVRTGDAGLRRRLTEDELVSYLLVLHGLHPLDLATRVRRALDEVRPRLPGAKPELVGVDAGVVRLRLSGGGGCRSSAAKLRQVLEEAVRAAAPEVERVEVAEAGPAVLIPVDSLMAGPAPAGGTAGAGVIGR